MEITNLFSGAVILFFGLVIRIFKASGLIAGYNTASKEKKAQYDEESLTKFVGNMLIISSSVLIVGGLLSGIESIAKYSIIISWIVFFIFIIWMAIYTNTGNHFRKKHM